MFVCLSVCLFVCLSFRPSVCLFVWSLVSVCLSVCPSVFLYVYLCVGCDTMLGMLLDLIVKHPLELVKKTKVHSLAHSNFWKLED